MTAPMLATTGSGAQPWSYDQIVQLAQGAGLSQGQAKTAAAIAMAESGGRPWAHANAATGMPNDDSYGLWQINMLGGLGPARRAQLGIASNDQLLDPTTNAKAMALISGGGTHWGDWTTYTSGAYKPFLAGGADVGTGATADPGQTGSVNAEDNPCIIGGWTMPGPIPNVPCLFYKSWGWALLGGLALVGGALVTVTGVVLVVARPPSVRQAAGMVTGGFTGLGSRSGAVSRGGLSRPLRSQDDTDDENELLRQQAEAPRTRVADADRRYQNREPSF